MHDLQGALHLDIEDNVLPLRHGFVHIALGRAVKVADILGILQKKASSEIILRNSSTSVK